MELAGSTWTRSMNPIHVFPTEIWEMILIQTYNKNGRRHIVKSKDLIWFAVNFENLEKLLFSYKSAFLFEKVIEIVIQMLNKDEIYTCRLACKRWMTAIDLFLENPPCLGPFNEDIFFKHCYSVEDYNRFPVRLMFEKTLNRFETIGISSVNPFIGRSVVINPEITNFGWENEFAEHSSSKFEKLCKILGWLGKFVYHLEWVVLSPSVNGNQFYLILCRVLSLLPNLKTLRIRFWVNKKRDLEFKGTIFDKLVLPQSKLLYFVDLNIFHLPGCIEEKIIGSFGSSVQRLCMSISFSSINALHSGMKNLKELSVRSVYDLALFKQLLKKIVKTKLPIEKLEFEFNGSFDISEILDELHVLNIRSISFGRSELKDKMYHRNNDNESFWLTSIHTCEICDSFDVEYNFLKLLPNLKYLIITGRCLVEKWFTNLFHNKLVEQENIRIHDEIRLTIYCGLAPSKLFWQTFPKLKYIIAETSVQTSGFIFPINLQNPGTVRYPRPY